MTSDILLSTLATVQVALVNTCKFIHALFDAGQTCEVRQVCSVDVTLPSETKNVLLNSK